MQKALLTFTIIFLASISNNLFALEKGSWTLSKDDDWCYIGSLPIKSDLSETKKRGENYILVYKIIGSDENIVQVEAGYKYNLEKDIIVKIDNTSFKFYSTEDSFETAWTDDDSEVIIEPWISINGEEEFQVFSPIIQELNLGENISLISLIDD